MRNSDTAFIFHPKALHYRFSDTHPFNQQRIIYTHDLLLEIGALPEENMVVPTIADMDALRAVHTNEYIAIVQSLSERRRNYEAVVRAGQYGLGDEDTPYFPNMHEAAMTIVSGTIQAAEMVMSGATKQALHLAGGLHHAFANRAAGFCVYNDAAAAIAQIRKRYQARVLYIDTDVHHGDGVQDAFYADPHVCTFSIHETGKYLYPGTGFPNERGIGEGFGTSFNLPMEPFTEDESWLSNFREAAERIAASFKPDIIISQHGCDAHYYDPLSHGYCSMNIYHEMPRIIKDLANHWCDGRWVALGGGGYDIWRVVPRAWSLLWLTMIDHPIVNELDKANKQLPASWIKKYQPESPVMLPGYWLDHKDAWEAIPRREEISAKNKQHTEIALLYIP